MGKQGYHLPDLSEFRERCCYCYKDLDDGISLCMCGLSLCGDHVMIHTDKSECSVSFEIRRRCLLDSDGERVCKDMDPIEFLDVSSSLFSDEEVASVKRSISLVMQCQNGDEKIILKDDEVSCPHLEIDCEGEIEIDDLDKLKCSSCDIKTRLWICFICGHIGCGRAQYGAEGNGHAKEHYEQTQHKTFVLISSLDNPAGSETFCYPCGSNIKNIFVNKRLKYTGSVGRSKHDLKEKQSIENNKAVSVPSPFVGIVNAGNTCYISSTLHMIGYVVSKQDLDLEMHFQICWMENPLECFFCQLMRVFNRMKKCNGREDIGRISIVDLVRLIWRDMPLFTKHVQHDAHEFLLFLLEKIQEGETAYMIPPITSLFEFEVGRKISCNKCMDESIGYERTSMLCTIIESRIRDCVADFFSEDQWDCSCGGKKKAIKYLTKLPEYLILQVGRYSYDGAGFGKINDRICMETLKLDRFMSKVKPEDLLVERLVDEGHSEDDVRTTLSLYCNDEEKSLIVLQSMSSGSRRTDPNYCAVGCINHSGANTKTGHYTWWVYDKKRCYLVDDTNVLDSSVEVLESGYIFLFR